MSQYLSPFRYPGGKAKFADFLASLIDKNQPINVYVEPYAGGAGAALDLLFRNSIRKIILNDADYFIYSFWKKILNDTDTFIKKIQETEVNLENWKYYREVYQKREFDEHSELDIAFTAFYLNRCNRSGILIAGPIGGFEQKSKWKIDCRYNKEKLIKRIKNIAKRSNRIEVYNFDAIDFIEFCNNERKLNPVDTLYYLDPPYVDKGNSLYRRSYDKMDHQKLNSYLKSKTEMKWVLSYDDVDLIQRLYADVQKNGIDVNHFAHKAKIGKELLILSDKCSFPELV